MQSSQMFSLGALRRLLATVAAALMLGIAPAHAQEVTGLPDFTGIVAQVDSGVVNIRTTATVLCVRGQGVAAIPTKCSVGFLGLTSSLLAVSCLAGLNSLSSPKSTPCRVAWVRGFLSLKTATS